MAASAPRAGDVLGHYRLLEQVGAGGMGVVFRARDEKLDRQVAVKVIAPGLLADETARRRFRNEAAALSRLNHPNIQTVHDFDTHDGTDFLVVEFIEGESLDSRVARGPLAPAEVVATGRQLLRALGAAHAAGIIHRDLKPGNLRLRPDGHLKVLDFGLAKPLPSAEALTAEGISVTGAIPGTLPYIAPEVLRGAPADRGSDIYAAGAVLYELATGRRPHPETGSLLVDAILNRAPRPPSMLHRDFPASLEQAILKALDKTPEHRWSSANDFALELDRVSGALASAAAPAPPAMSGPATGARLRRRVLIGLGTVLVTVLVSVMAVLPAWRRSAGPPAATQSIDSLVVLPLKNVSGDAAQDYFAEAMSDEVSSEIAALRSVRVISRSSARAYASRAKPPRAIARELDVDALVDGSVLRAGEQVRVSVELVDGTTGRLLWSRSYEGGGRDVIALQRTVARALAQELHVALSPAEQQRLATPMTGSTQAYEAYLRATYWLGSVFTGSERVDAALRYAEEAVALDPDFAEAHVAVARACTAKIFGWGGGAEYDERAFVAIGRALAINPNLADAYVVRGNLRFTQLHGFDVAQAVSDYRRALALNSNLSSAHHSLGSELTHAGLHDAAIEAFRAALKIDPHEDGPAMRLGRALWQSNRFAEAVEHYRQFGLNHVERSLALAYLGRLAEARELLQRISPPVHRGGVVTNYDAAAVAALIAAMEGRRADAERAIQGAVRAGADRDHFHHAAFAIAAAYAELANAREAVRWLDFAANRGLPNLPLFRDNPSMQKLRGSPEYTAFLQQLEPRWQALIRAL